MSSTISISTISLAAALATALAACGNDGPRSDCPPDEAYFQDRVWRPAIASRCVACHAGTGIGAASSFRLDPDDMAGNLEVATALALREVGGVPLLLAKPTGAAAHGGGLVLAPGGAEARALESFVAKVRGAPGACDDLIACRAGDPGPRLLRRLSRTELDNTIAALFAIDADYGPGLSPDVVVGGFDNNAHALTVSPLLADQLRQVAEDVAARAVAQPAIVACAADGAACARDFLVERGARVFRRPLTDDELARWLAVYQLGAETADGAPPHHAGLELVIAGLLQSPAFLYRSELGEPAAGGRFELTSYEVAAELSYFLWASPPDDELWAAAVADELRDPAAIERHARRMLASPRARAAIDRFTAQWLAIDQLAIVAKDAATYPDLTPGIRAAMGEEARRLVVDVIQTGGTLEDLLTAPYTVANAALAAFYGLPAPAAPGPDGFGRVELGGSPRAGLLGLGAVLTTHARANASSPIHRGKLVRERLLCQHLPPPPPGLNAEPPPVDTSSTTRERYAQHARDTACAGCHSLIDPIGFALEHFDGIGRYRADEHGLPIDARGEIVSTDASDGAFTGLAGLSTQLARSPDVRACFTVEWLRWAYGVEEDAQLSCLVDELAERFTAGELAIEELLVALTQTSHFRIRKGEGGGAGEGEGEDDGGAGSGGGGGGGNNGGGGNGGGTPGVTVAVVVTSQWGTGYCAAVRVTNTTGAAITGWHTTTTLDGAVYDRWNCEIVQSGTTATISGAQTIAAGATIEQAGFCANL